MSTLKKTFSMISKPCQNLETVEMRKKAYYDKHVIPRVEKNKPFLEWDEKAEYTILLKTAEEMERVWDLKEE